MPTRELLIFIALSVAAAGIVVAAVTVYKRSYPRPDINAPTVRNETDKPSGPAKADGPLVHVEEGGKDFSKDAPDGSKSTAN